MSFPITYEELRKLARKTFLHTLVARGVARKAGLISAPGTSPARTVIDAYVHPLEGVLGRQYAADFTGETRMRLTSQSNVPIYVHYSLQDPPDNTLLDPTDYQPLWGFDADGNFTTLSALIAESTGDLRWLTIPDFLRVSLRLVVSTQSETPAMNSDILDGSFSMMLQVA